MPGRNCWNEGGRELGPPELLRLDEMGRGGVVLCPSKVFCETLKLAIQTSNLGLPSPLTHSIMQGRPARTSKALDLGTNWWRSSPWSDRGRPAHCSWEATRPLHGRGNRLWRGWVIPADREPYDHPNSRPRGHETGGGGFRKALDMLRGAEARAR